MFFSKYQGRGNDFILIDDRKELFPIHRKEFFSQLCHRQLGIGADGILLLQGSRTADFRLRIWNSDGSEAASCGNGLCCLYQFIKDLGLVKGDCSIETKSGRVYLKEQEGEVVLSVPLPRIFTLQALLTLREREIEYAWVDSGVPHVICFIGSEEKVSVVELGREIRFHKHFQPEGVNVNFVVLEGTNQLFVRTYERGVEGETLCCGTGAIATAFVAMESKRCSSPTHVRFTYGTLEVRNDDKKGISMKGKATFVYSGKIDV